MKNLEGKIDNLTTSVNDLKNEVVSYRGEIHETMKSHAVIDERLKQGVETFKTINTKLESKIDKKWLYMIFAGVLIGCAIVGVQLTGLGLLK